MEEIKGYGKVRRRKYGASMKIYGDKEDMCEKEQVWKCMKKGESMKKYENVWRKGLDVI